MRIFSSSCIDFIQIISIRALDIVLQKHKSKELAVSECIRQVERELLIYQVCVLYTVQIGKTEIAQELLNLSGTRTRVKLD